MLAVLGNVTYATSVLMNTHSWQFLLQKLPWLVGRCVLRNICVITLTDNMVVIDGIESLPSPPCRTPGHHVALSLHLNSPIARSLGTLSFDFMIAAQFVKYGDREVPLVVLGADEATPLMKEEGVAHMALDDSRDVCVRCCKSGSFVIGCMFGALRLIGLRGCCCEGRRDVMMSREAPFGRF